jgi:hypothetical protein
MPIPTIITVLCGQELSRSSRRRRPATFLIKKALNLKSGSKEPGNHCLLAAITRAQLREIARPRWLTSTRTILTPRRRSLRAPPARWASKWWRAEPHGIPEQEGEEGLAERSTATKLHGVDEAIRW